MIGSSRSPPVTGNTGLDGPRGIVRTRFQIDYAIGRVTTDAEAEGAVNVTRTRVELGR